MFKGFKIYSNVRNFFTQKVFQSNPCKEVEEHIRKAQKHASAITALAKQNSKDWRMKYISTSLKEREYIENRIDEIIVEDFISSDPENGNSMVDLAYYLTIQNANYAVAKNFIKPSVVEYIFPPGEGFDSSTIFPLSNLEPRTKSWKEQ